MLERLFEMCSIQVHHQIRLKEKLNDLEQCPFKEIQDLYLGGRLPPKDELETLFFDSFLAKYPY